MSRLARRISETGLYHIIFRGINKENVFYEDADYKKIKEIIRRVKNEMGFELYAYCLMTNHVHLFLKEKNPGEIAKIMSKLLSHYATWFNKKYERSGALFGNRYKSEPVEDDRYLISLMRYIHQNPVKAGIVKSVEEYPHSSYSEYIEKNEDMVDTYFILEILSEDRDNAISQFVDINKTMEKEEFEITDSRKNSARIRRTVMSMIGGTDPLEMKNIDANLRNTVIRKLVMEEGVSKSGLSRVIDISRHTISKICNDNQQKLPRPQIVKEEKSDTPNLPAYLM